MKSKTFESGWKSSFAWLAVLFAVAAAAPLRADVISLSGAINQSVSDGTGPAVNNPGLNNISDGADYTVNINFLGSITAPGTYTLAGSSVLFSVASAGVTESDFDSVSLTVAPVGGLDEISLFACLTTGSGCDQGNELAMSFFVPAAQLNAADVSAFAVGGLLPLDLLEDDGVTDIHGTIAHYSYTPPAGTPEPATLAEFGTALVAIGFARYRRRTARQ